MIVQRRINAQAILLIFTMFLISCQFNTMTALENVEETLQTGELQAETAYPVALDATNNEPSYGVRIELPGTKRWKDVLRFGDSWRYGTTVLSPNGAWVASNASQEPINYDFLDILSVEDEDIEFRYQPETSLGSIGPGSIVWSPDSKHLAYWGVDTPKPYCYHNRLVIVSIDSLDLKVNPSIFDLPGEESQCATFTWSPDGTKLAVIPDSLMGEIYILNTKGEVISKLPVDIVESTNNVSITLGNLTWALDNLFYSVYVKAGEPTSTELYQVDLNTHESFNVFRLGEWHLFDNDPSGSSRFLLTRSLSQYYDPTLPHPRVDEYAILDAQSKEIVKLEWESPMCKVFSSTNKFTAFACDNPNELWIYNWEDESLTSYGEYNEVFGWSDEHQGYLLSSGTEQNLKVEVLQP